MVIKFSCREIRRTAQIFYAPFRAVITLVLINSKNFFYRPLASTENKQENIWAEISEKQENIAEFRDKMNDERTLTTPPISRSKRLVKCESGSRTEGKLNNYTLQIQKRPKNHAFYVILFFYRGNRNS